MRRFLAQAIEGGPELLPLRKFPHLPFQFRERPRGRVPCAPLAPVELALGLGFVAGLLGLELGRPPRAGLPFEILRMGLNVFPRLPHRFLRGVCATLHIGREGGIRKGRDRRGGLSGDRSGRRRRPG